MHACIRARASGVRRHEQVTPDGAAPTQTEVKRGKTMSSTLKSWQHASFHVLCVGGLGIEQLRRHPLPANQDRVTRQDEQKGHAVFRTVMEGADASRRICRVSELDASKMPANDIGFQSCSSHSISDLYPFHPRGCIAEPPPVRKTKRNIAKGKTKTAVAEPLFLRVFRREGRSLPILCRPQV